MPRASRFSLHSFLVAAALLLAACAHDLSYMEMKALMPPAPADKGRIYFYRNTAWLGNLVTPDILLDNVSIGVSNPGSFFYVDRPPGDYRIVCGNNGFDHAISMSLAAGQEIYVRTEITGGIVTANMETEVIDPTVAVPEMRGLKYYAVK